MNENRDFKSLAARISAGKAPRLLLLFGDDLEVGEAAKAILDALVPEHQRAFNLERFDGRTVTWEQVEASLVTPPFFPGQKVLWVENAPYFFSREQKGELGERVLRLWNEARKEEAAKLLLDLLVVTGWTDEQWSQLESAGPLAEALGGEIETREQAEALLTFCRELGLGLKGRKGAGDQRIVHWIERGFPEWAVLLLTAVQVDRRTRLYKGLEEIGATLNLGFERDRNGKLNPQNLSEFILRRLRAAGKSLAPQARELILSRAGRNLRGLSQELEKLILYVSDQDAIRAEDVAAVFADAGEDWIFDLTRALGEGDRVAALTHLARLLGQGEHPLKLLGTIAAEVRRLVSARQLLDNEWHACWRRGMSYAQFQQTITRNGLPLLTQNGYADYMCLQRAEKFSLAALRHYLGLVHETDLRLKSSGGDPRRVMEGLVLAMCFRN